VREDGGGVLEDLLECASGVVCSVFRDAICHVFAIMALLNSASVSHGSANGFSSLPFQKIASANAWWLTLQ
jgi:hypothetical protein